MVLVAVSRYIRCSRHFNAHTRARQQALLSGLLRSLHVYAYQHSYMLGFSRNFLLDRAEKSKKESLNKRSPRSVVKQP